MIDRRSSPRANLSLLIGLAFATPAQAQEGAAVASHISNTLVQPFLSKTLPSSTSFSPATESSYNWETKKWIVPVVVGVSHIYKWGKQPVQIGPAVIYYASSPIGEAEWGGRLNITLRFPNK